MIDAVGEDTSGIKLAVGSFLTLYLTLKYIRAYIIFIDIFLFVQS